MANARTTIQAKAPTPNSNLVTPIATLREQIMRLEAAIVVCRVRPKKEPVHTLRKATRYVEAQLALLELLPHVPPHTKEADKVRKRLKSVRKAAGIVRDFDVQRKLVQDDTPNRSAAKADPPDDPVHRAAKALAKDLKLQRNQETAKLTALLRVEEKRLTKWLTKLEDALEPAEQRAVPADRLAASIEHWFEANTPRPPANASNGQQTGRLHNIRPLDEDALHALRKASKLCRYMAESLPTDLAAAKRLTDRFEALQESGGKWHDWLLLQEIAAKHHGNGAALTDRYTQHRDAALASYQTQLANLLTPKRTPRGTA
jgi:CHAD domain-containing protein